MDLKSMELLAGLVIGAAATFCAILLWPRTREVAWMLVIIGIVLHYGVVVLVALEGFGFIHMNLPPTWWAGLLRGTIVNAPFLLFTVAFIMLARRKL